MFRRFVVLLTIVIVIFSATAMAAQRRVIAEEFTNTMCENCPGAMVGLHDLEQQVGDRLAVIAYHHSSMGGDPFYLPEFFTRAIYYDVTGIPAVWFDGVIQRLDGSADPGNPVDYTDSYQEREGIESPVTFDLTLVTYNGATGQGTVRAEIYNETGSTVEGQLRFVAAGNDTLYDWMGYDHLYFTALQIFPDPQGATISIDPSQTHVEVQDFLLPDGWRDRDCTIVGFLQDDETKEILQGANLSQVTPVELVGFTGRATREGVLLSWSTASETENAGFRIYRATNGHEDLLTSTMIPGAGTTAVPKRYDYADRNVEPDTTCLYRLSDVSLSGVERFHSPISITIPGTWGAPSALHLEPVSPCPASSDVSIPFSLPGNTDAHIRIFDMAGRAVQSLQSAQGEAGTHAVTWDLTDSRGSRVSPGLYIVRLRAGNEEVSGRIVVVR